MFVKQHWYDVLSCLTLSFVMHNKKAGIVFLILSSITVLARVLSGIHWFSDVVVGAVIGIVAAWIIVRKIGAPFFK